VFPLTEGEKNPEPHWILEGAKEKPEKEKHDLLISRYTLPSSRG